MRYLYKRGPGADRRVMHLCGFDPCTGEPVFLAICGQRLDFNTTINPPFGLGRPICKRCQKVAA